MVDGVGLSDTSSQHVGIRCIESVVDPQLKGHVFVINGHKARPWLHCALCSRIFEGLCRLGLQGTGAAVPA